MDFHAGQCILEQQTRLELLYLGRMEVRSGELLGPLGSDQEHTTNLHKFYIDIS